MKRIKLAALALSLVGILSAGNALAATSANVDITVTATVVTSCSFNATAPTMAFTPIDPTSGSTYTAAAAIKFTCTKNAPWNFSDVVATDKPLGAGGLLYSIPTATPTGSGTGVEQTVTLTGTILPYQYANAVAGIYTGTHNVVINF